MMLPAVEDTLADLFAGTWICEYQFRCGDDPGPYSIECVLWKKLPARIRRGGSPIGRRVRDPQAVQL